MKAVLAVESLMSKSAVLRQLSEQCRGGTFIAEGVEKKIWGDLFDKEMKRFLVSWDGKEKVPVETIGPQVALWPNKLNEFKPEHLFYFFNKEDGILDYKGRKPEACQVAFDPAQMKGCKEIHYTPSGAPGFAAYLE